MTNYQRSGAPLGAAFALICSSRLCTFWKQKSNFGSMASTWLAFCAFGFVLYSTSIDTLSILNAIAQKSVSDGRVVPHFDADALSGLVTFGPEYSPDRPVDGEWLAQYVHDGL